MSKGPQNIAGVGGSRNFQIPKLDFTKLKPEEFE